MNANNVSERYYRRSQYIEKIEVTNLRGIRNIELKPEIGEKGGSWLAIVGENGTGKSSLLQMLACALSGKLITSRMKIVASSYVSEGCESCRVAVHLTGLSDPIVLTLASRDNLINIEPASPKVIVLAYGATRLLSRNGKGSTDGARLNIRNIFDPFSLLADGRSWLLGLEIADFDRASKALSALLPVSDGVRLVRVDGEVYIQSGGRADSLFELSSGYQAILGLALDIMSFFRRSWEDMESAEGIVLIDEIDAHLHPRWKLRVVGKLREVFPRIQFIASTHDPLTLRGLEGHEVAVIRRDLSGTSRLVDPTPNFISPKHMGVEQLLASEYFGLNSTEDTEVDHIYERYYQLLGKKDLHPDEEEELSSYRSRLDHRGQFGATPRERMIYEAADEIIADGKRQEGTVDRAAAREKLKSVWREVSLQSASQKKAGE
ncbi:hypothetical protein GCM10010080_24830 [Thermomonas carbonis]|nr:hypothetical protein GCM10010080_24830 [Thermomonas carbonis]